MRNTCTVHHKQHSALTEGALMINFGGIYTVIGVPEKAVQLGDGVHNTLAGEGIGGDKVAVGILVADGSAGAVEPGVHMYAGGHVTELVAGGARAGLGTAAVEVLVNALAH